MSKEAATAKPVRLPSDTPPSENPQFQGITAKELARALLKVEPGSKK